MQLMQGRIVGVPVPGVRRVPVVVLQVPVQERLSAQFDWAP